jgi:hypothetical protein
MCFDNGYSVGLEPEFMLKDIQKEVAASELGNMDGTIQLVMDKWKEDRGII